jgi:long-chain acyl-CoA synthetase
MNFVDLSQKEEVANLIREDIRNLNQKIPPESQIEKFALLSKDFHLDEGELSHTRKLKRSSLEKQYNSLLSALRDGTVHAKVEVLFKSRDGKDAMVKTEITIWNVNEVAP